MEFIKNSILNSNLAKLFDLSDINWLECHEYACRNLVKKASSLYKSGISNITEISKILGVCYNTAQKYLKQGKELNWCAYDARTEYTKRHEDSKKQVICVNTGIIYDSMREANEKTGASVGGISNCCLGKSNFTGRKGEHLIFMYYEDYLNGKEKILCATKTKK